MKNTNKLPQDLGNYVKTNILRRVLPCIGIEILLVGALTVFRERLISDEIPMAAVFLYALAVLLPLRITGIPKKLIDKTYWGEILAIEIRATLDPGKGIDRPRIRPRNDFILTIRTDEGKTLRRCGISTTGKLEHKMDVYHVGDRVFHLYGTPYVIAFPTAAESTVLCPVCATNNATDRNTCSNCGHTLVKK